MKINGELLRIIVAMLLMALASFVMGAAACYLYFLWSGALLID